MNYARIVFIYWSLEELDAKNGLPILLCKMLDPYVPIVCWNFVY